ncbi:hypothetical protein PENTCL1PPCAC_8306, partial [Pristionchus entomophagus]
MNMLTNSTVYLVNNGEIQKSIRSMVGWSSAIHAKMAASAISYLVGGVFGVVGIIALVLNITVLLAMFKGKLFSNRHSPVYILSSQTLLVDTLMVICHLGYQCPSGMFQVLTVQPKILVVLNAIFMYCWYHNSLSHILIAMNRLFVIVLPSINLFTRPVTIAICAFQHALALLLAIAAQFLLPCC